MMAETDSCSIIARSALLEFNSSFKGREFYTDFFSKKYAVRMAQKATTRKATLPQWTQRLLGRLDERGWSVAELGRRMNGGQDADTTELDKLYKYTKGRVKQPRNDMLDRIARALDMAPSDLLYGESAPMPATVHRLRDGPASVPTLGEVAANVWRDVASNDQAAFEDDGLAVPADTRFPASSQYDLVVRGTSINKFAPDGHRLRVVEVARKEAQEGDIVIVRRTRDAGQVVETSAKMLRRRGNSYELWPMSDDPRWQTPLPYGEDGEDRETVEIIGVVLFTYQTPRGR